MAAAKQQEEKRTQFLRRMVALPHNRHCFDCGQRGPTYVNMTIGSYVCTACSGILRGINPPHRVKSVSMASFTQEEIDLLAQRGNEYNKQVWLGLHETKQPPTMDAKDELKLRDYLTQKYERKRWYQAPTDDLAEAAKLMNNQTSSHTAASANRRPMVGGFRIQTGPIANSNVTSSAPKTLPPPSASAIPVSAPISTSTAPTHQPLSAQSSTTSAELLSDVFGASRGVPAANDFSQPNFANFGGATSTSVPVPVPTNQPMMSNKPLISTDSEVLVAASIGSTSGISELDNGMNSMSAANANNWSTLTTTAPTTLDPGLNSSGVAGLGGNKYASLEGLFSDMTTEPAPSVVSTTQGPGAVNWNAINWNGGAGAPSSSGTVLGSSPSTGISWGAPAPTQTNTNVFGGMQSQPTPVSTGWGAAPAPAPSSGVNPFLVTSAPQNPSYGGFPTQQPMGLGAPQQPMGMGVAPAGMSAGGFHTQSIPSAYQMGTGPQSMPVGVNAFPGAQMPLNTASYSAGNPMLSKQMGGAQMVAPTNQWAAAPNKQPTSVNPFLMQPQAPPMHQQTTATTNPFL